MGRATAYDLTQFAPEEKRQQRVRVVKTDRKGREKRQFKIRLVLSVVILFVLMAATVYSRMRLTEYKRATIAANQELTEISSENAYLNYELESKVSLRNAEDYAVKELGLVRLDSSQVEYVHLNDDNKIESEPKGGNELLEFLQRIIDFLFGRNR